MTTQTFDAHGTSHHHLTRDAAILLLAMAAAFIAGRVTRGAPEARSGPPATRVRAALPPAAAPEPPWKAQGCKDHETVDDICTDPACNG